MSDTCIHCNKKPTAWQGTLWCSPKCERAQKRGNALEQFVEYCWLFYGPDGEFGSTFGNKLTKPELEAAARLRMFTADFAGDSIDRECVREILLFARNTQALAQLAMG